MRYFYSYEGRTLGPVSPDGIMDLILSDKLDMDSYVMAVKEPRWLKIRDVPELVRHLHESGTRIPASDIDIEGFRALGDEEPIYFHIPMSRLVFSYLFTLGFYGVYWLFKNWSFLRYKRKGKTGTSFLRDSGNPLLIVNVFSQISYDRELNSAARSERDFAFYGWMWLIFYWLCIFFLLFGSKLSPGIHWLMQTVTYLIPLWFLVKVQRYVNQANSKLGRRYSTVESGERLVKVVVVISLLIWLFSVFGNGFGLFRLLF